MEIVTELFNEGYEPEQIGEALKRDPDEIFIALFHQAIEGKLTREFAWRCKS
ncbi:hypothetical protein [Gracilibacillus xinjiangensis]|uniref:Uncharacterized protein n=1 Tax=Gracilibacillus xinjiangensis TaxID=1193282 RepID=A0ABV8WVJ2_9BACI